MIDIEILVSTLLKESTDKLRGIFGFDQVLDIALDIPKSSTFGDLASNIALKLGRQIRHPAKELAHIMVDDMRERIKLPPYDAIVAKIEVGAPGFINFFLKEESFYHVLDSIAKSGKNFGRRSISRRELLNIEFVSANPTGPLTIAHGRQAAFGDSLANILQFSGYSVRREYYINDEGRQISLLGASIQAQYLRLIGQEAKDVPDGYKGSYIKEIAEIIKSRSGARKKNAPIKYFADFGCKYILRGIKEDLKQFNVKFDIWYSQKSLRTSGKIKKALSVLDASGMLYKAEGALWLKSSMHGDEKDRVVIKSDGSFTYLGPDMAYHMDKYRRRFKRLIDIWGPDHHGYIPRIKASIIGLGHNADTLSALIVQLVTLYRGKSPIPMSTRAGSFITLREVSNEIGCDAARYFFLRRRRDSHLDFDLELAKKHSPDNPVFYIQYAHARICSILKYKTTRKYKAARKAQNTKLLNSKEELKILRLLRQFPMVIAGSAEALEPYRLLTYLEELAKGFHSFYNKHRVVSDEEDVTMARLYLVECTRTVLATGLGLLGVNAPTQM